MSANLLQTINTGLGRRTSQAPEREDFSKIATAVRIPNLIEIQRDSYNRFLQMDLLPEEREATGLQAVFRSVFPIADFRQTAELDFVEFHIGNWQCKCGRLEGLRYLRANCKSCGSLVKVDPLVPGETLCHNCGTFNAVRPTLCDNCGEPVGLKHKHDQQECQERGMTYSVPLKVKIRLTVFDIDAETQARTIRDIKEEEVFFGEIPLMTENGTFIINGTERVIVSQLHRSPGVFFDHDKGKTHSSGKYLFAARVIPYRGSWLDFEFDAKDICYVRIDRKRKLPASTLLLALDSARTEALRAERGEAALEPNEIRGMDAEEILNAFYGQVAFTRGPKGWSRPFDPDAFRGVKLAEPLVDAATGQVVAEKDAKLTPRAARKIAEGGTTEVLVGRADLLGRYVAEDLVDTTTGEIWAEAGEELTEPKLAAIEQAGLERLPTLAIDQTVGPWIRNTLAVDKNTGRDEALMDIYRVMRPGEPPTPETAET